MINTRNSHYHTGMHFICILTLNIEVNSSIVNANNLNFDLHLK